MPRLRMPGVFVAIRRVRKRADGSPSLEEKLRVENNDDDKRRNEGKCNRNRPIPVSLLSCPATSKTIFNDSLNGWTCYSSPTICTLFSFRLVTLARAYASLQRVSSSTVKRTICKKGEKFVRLNEGRCVGSNTLGGEESRAQKIDVIDLFILSSTCVYLFVDLLRLSSSSSSSSF